MGKKKVFMRQMVGLTLIVFVMLLLAITSARQLRNHSMGVS